MTEKDELIFGVGVCGYLDTSGHDPINLIWAEDSVLINMCSCILFSLIRADFPDLRKYNR